MLDGVMRKWIDPSLAGVARTCANWGITANQVTLFGFCLGVGAALAIALGQFVPALVLIVLSRICDGLDGAVARATQKTDFGGYLDIACDFAFYAIVPLAFVFHDPFGNGLAGAALLAAFYINGATFLGFAVLAERAGLETTSRGVKSLYFTSGLVEGTETIAFFVAFAIFPGAFAPLASLFALLCIITATSRVVLAWRMFKPTP